MATKVLEVRCVYCDATSSYVADEVTRSTTVLKGDGDRYVIACKHCGKKITVRGPLPF